MNRKSVDRLFSRLNNWARKHRSGMVILTSLFLTALLVHLLGWWETLGILFLKFGLGAKIAGAKTFTQAIIKAGGKKAIAVATGGMLAKRHIIDLLSRFFAEHSIKRYKKNLTLVLRQKFDEIRHSTFAKKLKAFGSMLLSVPAIYFFWTKVLSAAIQKFVYALLLPLLTLLWNMVVTSFNLLGFIFQILMLNLLFDTLANYNWGKKIIAFFDMLVGLMGKLFSLVNRLFGYIGLNPKRWLLDLSNRFNKWLESILDNGLSRHIRVRKRRDRYINTVEALSQKRFLYTIAKKERKISLWRQTKKLYMQKVLKKREWREVRKNRIHRWEKSRRTSTLNITNRIAQKRSRRSALLLPYHTIKYQNGQRVL